VATRCSGTKIANEAATTRGAATPIYYQQTSAERLLVSYATCPAAWWWRLAIGAHRRT
jgi:hypothetical protein